MLVDFVVCFTVMSVLFAPVLADDFAVDTLDLGGPRKAVAQIAKSDDGDLEVSIEMLAVKCFDKATNMQLNKEKAIQYVHLAIAEHLGIRDKKTTRLRLVGMTTKSVGLEGNRYNLTVTFPAPGPTRVSTSLNSDRKESNTETVEDHLSEPRITKIERSRRKTSLTDAADDFVETSQFLLQTFRAEIPVLPTESDDKIQSEFFEMIADLEEKVERDFDAIVGEVKSCKLLLSVEIESVVEQIASDREEVIKLLAKAADSQQRSKKDENP